jgi:hypothetical protein
MTAAVLPNADHVSSNDPVIEHPALSCILVATWTISESEREMSCIVAANLTALTDAADEDFNPMDEGMLLLIPKKNDFPTSNPVTSMREGRNCGNNMCGSWSVLGHESAAKASLVNSSGIVQPQPQPAAWRILMPP